MSDEQPKRNRGGRRPFPPGLARIHRLRICCNDEELMKFRLLATLNHGLDLNTMARDIILDELSEMLRDSPRPALLATLKAQGLDDGAIDALLKSL